MMLTKRSPAEKSYPFCPKAGLCQSEAGLVYMVAYYVQWLLVGSGHGCERWFPRLSIPLNSWGGFGVIESSCRAFGPPVPYPPLLPFRRKRAPAKNGRSLGRSLSGPQKGLKLGVSL